MLLERLLVLLIATVVLAAAYTLCRWSQSRRLAAAARTPLPADLDALVRAGRPALLYFTTADCVQCRFRQTPILKQLSAHTDVAVHTLDAVQHETAARFFGIMTVPTTVWLDAERRPVAVNHGLATLDQLLHQLSAPKAL
jgi:thioredoxin 1